MKKTSHPRLPALALLALGTLGLSSAASAACTNAALCTQTSSFSAQVTDFRVSSGGSRRIVDATVRIENRTTHPLTLTYVSGTGTVIDDQGNRYTVDNVRNANAVRAIGVINNTTFDPKFTLQPGEGSDARFEFAFDPGRAIVGTVFQMGMSLREIDTLAGGQQKPGREHALQFQSLADKLGGLQAAAPATAPATAAAATAATATVAAAATAPAGATGAGAGVPDAATVAAVDPCAGDARCRNAGPFTAQVTQVTSTTQRNQQLVGIRLQLRNIGTTPLVLGYVTNSGVMVDNAGNRYVVDWRYNNHVQGIGQVSRSKADPQFTLNPGESRSAMLQYSRYVGKSIIGTVFAPDFAIEQLEILPSQQIRSVREYSLSFSDVTAGTFAAAGITSGEGPVGDAAAVGEAVQGLANGLKSLFKKK